MMSAGRGSRRRDRDPFDGTHREGDMTRSSEDRVAVVYGVGGAIGGAVARTFAREGARVFLAGRTQGHLDAVARDIAAAGGRAETARLDVLDERAVEAHAAAVAAAAGGIDVVLDAVSVPHDQGTSLGDLSFEEFWRPVEGFSRGSFLTSRAVAPYLARDRPGVLLTSSEPGARLVVPGILGHGVSAAGKETLTRLLAAELAPAGVRVVGSRPHAVSFAPAAAAAGQTVQESLDDGPLAAGTSRGRLPTVQEVADAAAFLASDRAAAMTGTIVNLTGGAVPD
ncbi:hypothetical protein OY671_001901 [Metschnikowia pulcherrima]|nr:hypothetical protein OY671_001901 [Metschnikowia pulcherrima]